MTWSWDEATGLAVRTGQYDATGALSTAWLPDPTSATGGILAATTATGTGQWLLGDPFANVTAATSTTTATATGLAPLTAFGQPAAPATGTMTDQPLGFAGQYTDARTGLVDMRARDYDPTTGRFTTTDPISIPVGMAYVNGYTYAFNNPLSFTDVTGTARPRRRFRSRWWIDRVWTIGCWGGAHYKTLCRGHLRNVHRRRNRRCVVRGIERRN